MPLRSLFHSWSSFSFIPQQLRWLFFSVTMQRLAEALLLVVGPLYLYQLAPQVPVINQVFESEIKTGLLFVTLFYLWERLSVLILAPFIAQLPSTKNLRLSLVLGRSATFLVVVLYTFLDQAIWLVAVLPILSALTLLWYWTSYYILLAAEMNLDKVGKEMGSLEVVSKLATLLGPLLGVLMVKSVSFQGVFWLGAFLHLLSIVGLLQLPALHIRTVWHWSDFYQAIKNLLARKQFLGLGGAYWETIGLQTFWPILLFIFFESMASVGYVFTGATLISLVFIYLSGWIFDHRKRKSHWEIGSGATMALLWIVRVFSLQFPLLTVATEAIDRIAAGVFNTLFSSLVVLRIRANNSILYAYNRQIAFALTYLLGGSFILLTLWLDLSLVWIMGSFFVGGLLALLFVTDRRLRYRLDT